MYVEITGWNKEGESTETSGDVQSDETLEQAIARLCKFWWIVEIGDVRVTGE